MATKRNALIVRRVVRDGMSQAAVARRFHLSTTLVCQIVRKALGLKTTKRPFPRSWSKRLSAAQRDPPPLVGKAVREPRTRAQRQRRDHEIYRLVMEKGVALATVARRYGLSEAGVRKIVERRLFDVQGH